MTNVSEIAMNWDGAAQTFRRAKRSAKFLKGPVPWDWIEAASILPGKSLAVGLAIWRLSGALKSKTVKLGNAETEALGIDRNAKSRALAALVSAGLIRVVQRPGCLPAVSILEAVRSGEKIVDGAPEAVESVPDEYPKLAVVEGVAV